MKEYVIDFRNKTNGFFYKHLLKPIFFMSDPEEVHDHMIDLGVRLGSSRVLQKMTSASFNYKNSRLKQEILGLSFKNPIGLSAGFDKNAELTDILPSVGFGFIEIGSITGNPCEGNAKPRLWRLKDSESLAVYYGLKNDGSEVISKRLASKNFKIPVGMSVAMTNCQANIDIDSAIKDYEKAFATMEHSASYVTINISCPNTLGGQPFIDPKNLEKLLSALDKIFTEKPIFIKISPDLSNSEIDNLLEVLKIHRVQGIICANLTKKLKDNPKILDKDVQIKGGISGKVVQENSDHLLSYIYKKEGTRFVLVGCGGVFTAEDAYKKIRLGASLIQMITGMIFEGPQVISQINQGLVELLKRDGFENIQDAIGVDSR